MTIVWLLLAGILLLLLAAALYLTRVMLLPKTVSSPDSYRIEVENGRLDEPWFQALDKQEVFLTSPFGYTLYGLYIPCDDSKKTIILSHGITYTLYGMMKFVKMFHQRNFNVLLIDHRHHGRSGGPNITYGYHEKHDLGVWFEWALEKIGPDGQIGTLGESMGAAIVLQHAALEPRLTFVIADCPFSDLRQMVTLRLRLDYRLPPFPIVPIATVLTRLISGMEIGAVSPIRDINNIQAPLLITHGKSDSYIPFEMSEALYAAKTDGFRRLYLIPGANHVESYLVDREGYERQVDALLNELPA